jgi:hypothetical protein
LVRTTPIPDEATAISRARVWLRDRQDPRPHRAAVANRTVM